MKKYVNNLMQIFEGTDYNWAILNGFTEKDVVQNFQGQWVLAEEAETPDFIKDKRLNEIEKELARVAKMQEEFLNTPIKYPANNCHYLPRYAQETYLALFQAEKLAQEMDLPSTFPQKIKDTTKLEENAHFMSYQELQRLALFLIQVGYQAWSQKEQAEAALLKEKQELLEGL